MRRHILFFVLFSFFLYGCDSGNLFYGVDNQQTNEAVTYELKHAFESGEYGKVVDILRQKQESNWVDDDAYWYVSSRLALTGMDITNVFETLTTQSTQAIDPYTMLQRLMGVNEISLDIVDLIRLEYADVLRVCNAGLNNSANMITVCGMAAAADTVMLTSSLVLVVTDATTGFQEISGDILRESIVNNGVTTEVVLEEYKLLSTAEQQELIDELQANLKSMEDTAGLLNEIAPGAGDFVTLFNDFSVQLEDETGQVTPESLSNYLANGLGNTN